MPLGFFFGVPAYFRVCFRILGRDDVDLVDLAMALDCRPMGNKTSLTVRASVLFDAQGTNWVSGCIQNVISGRIQNSISGYIQDALACGVQLG